MSKSIFPFNKALIYVISGFTFLNLAGCDDDPFVPQRPEAPESNVLEVTLPVIENEAENCGTYQPAYPENSHILLGLPDDSKPCIAVPDKYLINQGFYIQSYNNTKGIPNWVSWHLEYDDYKTGGRDGEFREDTKLPLAFNMVYHSDYTDSGFDRGHNIPSGDRTSSPVANNATFLMTNMIPQAPRNNQGPWATLENYIRSRYIGQGNEAYIIMGNYGVGGDGSKGAATTIGPGGKVTVPNRIWKVAVIIKEGNEDLNRITENTTIIAVDMPNSQTIDADWKKYITTVNAIEQETRYNLLSRVPQAVRDALKAKVYN